MNAPTINHRSPSKELPEHFGGLLDTIVLATERIRAVSLLVDQQLENQTVSNENIGICIDVIAREADDIDSWLLWWLNKTRESSS